MNTTSVTLLHSIQSGSDDAWTRLDVIYRPFVYRWFRRRSLPHEAAEDLAQEVMLVVARQLGRFQHSGRSGAFRAWLRRITIFEEKAYWRKASLRGQPVGGTSFLSILQSLEDDTCDLSAQWDQEHDQYVLQRLLDEIASEFSPTTMLAFRRLAVAGASPQQVAQEFDMSEAAVYTAKSRVMRRLRQEAEGLVDEDKFS